MMKKSATILAAAIFLALALFAESSTPVNSPSTTTACNGGQTPGSVFGVGRNAQQQQQQNNNNPVFSLRGGEVLEPATLTDVDSIIMRASAEGKAVVIDFSATWCGPCKMIAPIYHKLSESPSLKDRAVFLKVDVDENPDTAAKYSVSAMPTFVFIKKGDVVDRLMGANAARLQSMIEEIAGI
uniref:Thioredoxin domain-containing protein n=1 Tax=Helicotheca tamesis TaxID=374047 RepID=A0A7S2MV31_9STRA|mmetsp:Transcript_4061/g.5496  ORF Transcript_4061/g.5496 Transcript_4061/m.5496 type:complete len:183 (+) Transcript_4061:103-651(+)|eukprot:CAMPEP_0185728958 /NCGR_PEP_ID=MMETSP1171-20130828/4390_1 /TAXON_ID=374046 /ORGANISM="Helicotheca tamensis, Strain CCMP826" /LENGTH=182 /DNA_ID=CAMNT_0028397721 /DNA_START=72 /DNA_END=620 /DNA_ORIENTATION=+